MTIGKNELRVTAITLAAGTIGGGLVYLLGLPAAWLTGSMFVVMALAIKGVPVLIPDLLRQLIFVALGVQIGSGFSPETIDRIMTWPLSIAGLGVTMLLVILASAVFLATLAKWNRPTALYASVPGALSYVLALALRSSADVRLVMFAQLLRLVSLLAILPSLLTLSLTAPVLPATRATNLLDLLMLLALGGAMAYVLERRKFPAGALFGGMIGSAALHLTGAVSGQIPMAMLIPCQIVLGAVIGARFIDTNLDFLKKALAPSIGAFLIALLLSTAAALIVAWGLHLPAGQVVVAFAPGGIEAMTILAAVLGLDPAFVATHQLVRFFGLALFLPLIAKAFLREGQV
jgi:membrane AbrB-like protein